MTAQEIYRIIVEKGLYDFKTDQQFHVVRTRLNRDCEGWDFKAANSTKYFQLLSNGTFWFKDLPIPQDYHAKPIPKDQTRQRLKEWYSDYLVHFRGKLLADLMELNPVDFEFFCRNLIEAYGFFETEVTKVSRDGGIDGMGKYKVGFTKLDVAFECKRWTKNKVGSSVVRSFRGALDRSSLYGVLFTTSQFNKGAIKEAQQINKKPIVLIDGEGIVDIMIQKQFGVGLEESLPVYVNQLDLIL